MSNAWPSLRSAGRLLAQRPGVVLVAGLTLSLAIAGNTAIFTVINAALLRPISGVQRPEEIVSFERVQSGQVLGSFGYPDYLDYRTALRSVSGLAAESGSPVNFTRGGATERIRGVLVSGDYFEVLRIRPLLGRLLIPEDELTAGGNRVAVLSAGFWRRAFGADPGIVGQAILINGTPMTVVGVAQADFRGTRPQSRNDVWLPITLQPVAIPRLSSGILQNRAAGWIRIFGRRRAGTSVEAVQGEVTTVAERLAQEYPLTNKSRTATLYAGLGLEPDERGSLRGFLGLLLASVGLLQMIACVNVANLLLARGAARRREIAVRRALGANLWHLLRMFLAEGALLTGIPAAVGVWFAPGLAQGLAAFQQPAYTLQGLDLGLDWRVLGFTLGLTALTVLVFACAPALQASRVDLATPLKDETQGGTPGKSRLRGALVASQVALSLLLLAAAGSAARAMGHALAANPIEDPSRIALYSFDLTVQGYSAQQGRAFYRELQRRAAALPGVTSASLAFTLPPEEWPARRSIFHPGQEPTQEVLQGGEFELGIRVDVNFVAPEFFKTLGLSLLRGRDFTERDTETAPRVAIVNERLAERMWPGENPLGKRIAAPAWSGPAQPPAEVIGVTKDVRSRSLLGEPPLQLYLSLAQEYEGRAVLLVRSGIPPGSLTAAVRKGVAEIDPGLAIISTRTMEEHIAASLWQQRMAAALIGSFGALAALLAGMGLYAVAAHSVTARTREIGIRMALGADAARIRGLVIREGMGWVLGGAAAGFPAALGGTYLMKKWIPGAESSDAVSLGLLLGLLSAVGLLACYLPARRAAHIDPIVALRYQ